MPPKKGQPQESANERVYESEYRRHKIRIVEPDVTLRSDESVRATLYIDDEAFPVEVTERGVLSHEMAFKEYGSIDELAEDIIRQRGTAQIERGDQPDHDHSQHNHNGDRGQHDHGG
jgi:hypothetical protein